jgi:hypothetical protein
VLRDDSGNFSAGTITANLTGNASGTASNVTGIIAGVNGGTGVANTGKTITLGGNLATSGGFPLTMATTASTSITLPTTGTLATLTGTETLTKKTIENASLTGIPTAPTAATGISNTQVATTAFVSSAISSNNSNTATNLAAKQDVIQEVTDQTGDANVTTVITSTVTTFTLSQTPHSRSRVKMYINGIRIDNKAYAQSGATITYTTSANGGYTILSTDRVQFDYFY